MTQEKNKSINPLINLNEMPEHTLKDLLERFSDNTDMANVTKAIKEERAARELTKHGPINMYLMGD